MEVKDTQIDMQETKQTMASFMGTFEKYDSSIAHIEKSHGDLVETVDKLKDNMGQISTNVATLKVCVYSIDLMIVSNQIKTPVVFVYFT